MAKYFAIDAPHSSASAFLDESYQNHLTVQFTVLAITINLVGNDPQDAHFLRPPVLL